jgi:hypothetical protein
MGLISCLRRSIVIIAVLGLCPSAALAQSLAWDPNPETDIAGYRVYQGTESGKYTKQVDVGKVTTYTPAGTDWTKAQFFAVQAYNTSGLVSPLSAEVQWTPPAPSGAKLTSLTASSTSPFVSGTPVTWTATATASTPIEYKFWMYIKGAWKLVQDYGPSNKFTWTPDLTDVGGPSYLQVWARTTGATVDYQSWLGTPPFEVVKGTIELTADVDFPTPPNNPVTWKVTVADAGSDTFQYKFMLFSEETGQWTVLQDYGPNNHAVWVPDKVGRFAIQGWARRASNPSQEVWTSKYADVAQTGLTISSLTVDPVPPVATGTRLTWIARPQGGAAGPLEYQFWVFSQKKGWVVGQPYGPSKIFFWTPTFGDEGSTAIQVWVRNAGSTAQYEAWRGTTLFNINATDMHLTTTSLMPFAPGSQVNWLAQTDSASDFEYQFWVYKGSTASWSLGKPYNTEQTFSWTPATSDTYAIQAWARLTGSNAPYEKYRSTGLFSVQPGPTRIWALTTNVPLPVRAGTTIKWTARASGGTAQLQYQFWRWRAATGWVVVQDFSPSSTFTWTPTAGEAGQYAMQVWVKSAGSSFQYEAYMGTGVFTINP